MLESRASWLLPALRRHRLLVAVLGVAVLVRAAVLVAYWPAIHFSDSFNYLSLAATDPVGLAPHRPSGYPFVLKLLTLDGRSLSLLAAVQHVAGLMTAVLVYAIQLRMGVRRSVAVLAVAVVALDGYAVALEQYVLAEAFFGLILFASLFCATASEPGRRTLILSGALLAGAIAIRGVGIFAVPAWFAYLLLKHRSLALVAPAVLALALPLLLY